MPEAIRRWQTTVVTTAQLLVLRHVLSIGLFLNVHKIRVDSDNKR